MSVISAVRLKATFAPDEFEEPTERDPGLPRGFEFVDGRLQERNVSKLSSYIAGECYGHLRDFVRPRKLGWVFPEGTSYRCFAEDSMRVRRADTAFHHAAHLTVEQVLAEGHSTVVPDLVVEVISPHDLADEVNHKWLEWRRAGAALVWVVHPLDRTIHAYGSEGGFRLFTEADTLTAEPVLPDFRVPMAELFRLPGGA